MEGGGVGAKNARLLPEKANSCLSYQGWGEEGNTSIQKLRAAMTGGEGVRAGFGGFLDTTQKKKKKK